MTLFRRGYIFIDGGYLRSIVVREFIARPDIAEDPILFSTFLKLFGEKYWKSFSGIEINRLLYYDGIIPSDKDLEEHNKMLNFFNELRTQLDYFDVRLGDLIRDSQGKLKQKGVDVLISVDMVIKAFLNHYDVAILIAGDRDFVPAVRAVRELTGKYVYCIYAYKHIADELLRIVGVSLPIVKDDLKEIAEKISTY